MTRFIADVRIRKQDKSGNTYHDVTIIETNYMSIVDDVKKQYGYGSQYKQTVCDLINNREGSTYTFNNIQNDVTFIVHDPKGNITWVSRPL
jgi:hypothetical protein